MNHLDEEFVREYCARTGTPLPEGIGPAPGKRAKYGNVPVEVDGKWYPSKLQARWHEHYKALVRAGEIRAFAEEVTFPLTEKVSYRADFVLMNVDGTYTVVDAKGHKTDVYKIKKKLMRELLGIEIREV